jgi:hypothetical protein
MILDKEVEIKINAKNIEHFINLNYKVKIKDVITIPVEHLNRGSGKKIKIMCDVCGREKCAKYQDHYKILKKNNGFYKCQSCNLKSINKMYGTENVSQSKIVKEKIKKTCLKKYGVDNPSKVYLFKQKKIKTCRKNFKCNFPQQNIEIFNKSLSNGKKIKYYKGVYYQGKYELDFLKYCEENEILNYINRCFSINYNFKGGKHYYHPDYYIEKLNLIVEIKSSYWWKKHEIINEIKRETAINLGYNYVIILDKKYENFQLFINILK